jgi:hypothetical protein
LLLTLSCGAALPCTTCPELAGSYAASWKRAAGYEGCAVAPPPGTFSLTQSGASVRASLGDAALQGTLFDTFDLTLTGGADPRYALHARAVTTTVTVGWDGGAGADAGSQPRAAVRLVGALTTSPLDAGCDARDEFTADRVTP